MYNKKRVSMFITLLIVSIMLVGFVSAGWFSDLFKIGKGGEGLEGELPTQATAFVNVTGAQAPLIWYVSNLNESVSLVAGGVKYFSFNFYACSPGGAGILPDVTNAGTLVNGTFIGSYGTGSNPKATLALGCSYTGNEGVFAGTPAYCESQPSRNYSCVSALYYYYDPGTWNINASLKDTVNNLVTNTTKTFTISSFKAFDTVPTYLNWTAVTIGGSRQHADNNLTVKNTGNENINATYTLRLNATRLANITAVIGGPNPGSTNYIQANNFSAADINPTCSVYGTGLAQDVYVAIDSSVFVVDHTQSLPNAPKNNSLDFCLEELTGIGTAAYQSIRNWEMTYP